MKDGDPVTALYPARGGVLFEHARVQLAGSRAWAQTDKGWVRAARCRVGRDQVGSRLGRRRDGSSPAREVGSVISGLKSGDPVTVCPFLHKGAPIEVRVECPRVGIVFVDLGIYGCWICTNDIRQIVRMLKPEDEGVFL